jgi:hypothetical protein
MELKKLYVHGLLAALLATSAAVAQAAPAAGEGVSLRDGVVIDAARSIAYVMHPQGGIQALDLQQGTPLWRSTEGERPLVLAGALLVAQGRPGEHGELRIVALDVRRDGVRSSEADLPMPAGVRADAVESVQQEFRVTAAPSSQGILVAWESQMRPVLSGHSAVEPEAESKAAVHGEAGGPQGTALFDPRAGRLMPLEAADARQIAGVRTAAVVSHAAPDGEERRFASADGRHVLASRFTGDGYRWTITDAASGAVLGTVDSAVSMSPFVVAGTRLIHVAQPGYRREGTKLLDRPLRLRAVDLTTGGELWTQPIRDTAFRGPFPR